jgi:hypothetical protein
MSSALFFLEDSMSDNKAFLEGLCATADAHAKAGNLSVLNRLAVNPAVKHYYDNVFKLKSITHEQWERDYPSNVAAVNELREAYDEAIASRARQEELEAKVNAMSASIAEMSEAIKTLVKPAKASKPNKTEPAEEVVETEEA